MSVEILKGMMFVRRVLQRDPDKPINPMYLEAFPTNHWFWCFPYDDTSSSIKATTLKTLCYTANKRFHIVTATELSHLLPLKNRQLACLFDKMNNKVMEKDVLSAIITLMENTNITVYGLKRNTGNGDEYVFFSCSVHGVFDSVEL